MTRRDPFRATREAKGHHALSVLRPRRYPGEGFAADGGQSAIRRRRLCPNCGARFTTFERVQLRELTVVKKTGQREPFDRDKLLRSMRIALRKRNGRPERVERVVNGIVRRLESRAKARSRSAHRRDGDGGAGPARPGRLRPLRLGLPELPRGKRFRGLHRRGPAPRATEDPPTA